MALTRKATGAHAAPSDTAGLLHRVLAQTLQKNASFKDIPNATLAALTREFKIRTYAPHETIFFEGQNPEEVLLMLRGVATLTYLDSRHRRVLFAVIGPGEICAHAHILPEPLRGRLRCDAVRDCVIASLDYKRLVEILFGVSFGRFAAGASFLFGTRDGRLAAAMLGRGKTLRERLLEVIGDLCARFGVSEAQGSVLDLPLTHEDLADLAGASRPKVTREVRLLEKEGVLGRDGRRLVLKKKQIVTS
jgi:CRP/FNR family transcriptional regulator, cyclic AMP receptor protein